MTIEELREQLESFEGDKRTKEYKDLRDKYNELALASLAPKTLYDKIKGFNGVVKQKDVDWFFEEFNKEFKTNHKPCNCPGQVRVMINRIKKRYGNTKE